MVTTTGDSEPLPIQIETTDVESLEAAVGVLRALDYRQGGAFCRDAVRVVKTASLLLNWGTVPGPLRARLCTVLADVHNLLGWTEFDIGRRDPARHRFERALDLATQAGNDNLVANIHYRLGRVHLHHHDVDSALAEFARGREAALRSGSARALAILTANEAWAHAMSGDEQAALSRLTEAESAFADAASWPEPQPWEAFFGEADMAAMRGTVLTELAEVVSPRHGAPAVTQLTQAVSGYGDDMARSRSLTMIMLAQNHARQGNLEEAAEIGGEAVDLARRVGSIRPKDRLRPLERLLRLRLSEQKGSSAARDLLEQVMTYRREPLV